MASLGGACTQLRLPVPVSRGLTDYRPVVYSSAAPSLSTSSGEFSRNGSIFSQLHSSLTVNRLNARRFSLKPRRIDLRPVNYRQAVKVTATGLSGENGNANGSLPTDAEGAATLSESRNELGGSGEGGSGEGGSKASVNPLPGVSAESGGSDGRKVVVIGAGWAGLGAAHHLTKQGYDVTLLEAGRQPGGLVAGWRSDKGKPVEVGIHGFWYPYRNIFALTDELGLKPFTDWTRSAQYSPAGLEVESPIFQDLPRLPSPLGTFVWTQFKRLPLADRLSALALMYAMVDFDNSDDAWRRYDRLTARELFKQYGCTDRVYREAFNPMLLVGLFAPGEQCSAAATLGMLYYFILAHQADFDVVWCRGTVGETIFAPWIQTMEASGNFRFLPNRRVTDIATAEDDPDRVTAVVCGDEVFAADAVVSAVGISGLKNIVASSPALSSRKEFLGVANLGAIDVLAVRLWLDRKITIPKPSNACFGFDETTGWTFFDLNAIHDEYKDEPCTVVEADFYHANQYLPMSDEAIVATVMRYLATCLPAFASAQVTDSAVVRFPRAVTHFSPGSYQHLLPATTSFTNLFMAGDWIITRHGSWSQEKAYVTGLEAANRVVRLVVEGEPATIIPVERDEEHIEQLRQLNQSAKQAINLLPFAGTLLQ
ncbi:unnamed protein product [Closterium sp. NIES-64]|nr:unnamed protein product [Closterium sp. NIES-64]